MARKNNRKIQVKIPRKCYNREAHSSRGTKRRGDEKQVRTKQTPPQTYKEELQQTNSLLTVSRKKNYLGRRLKPVLLARNPTLKSDAVPIHRYVRSAKGSSTTSVKHYSEPHRFKTMMKHGKGRNFDLTPEHKETTNRTASIESRVSTIWNI